MLLEPVLTNPIPIHEADALLARLDGPSSPSRRPVVHGGPVRYRLRQRAMDAAMAVLGPMARHEFEYDTFRVDGWWIWKPTDEVPAVARNSFQAKMDGGRRAAARIGAKTVKTATVVLELPEGQALALAQLCQRLTTEQIIELSRGKGDMDVAVSKLGSALKEAGFNPQ